MIPAKKTTHSPNKVHTVTPSKTVRKPFINSVKVVVTTKTNTLTTKPPKKSPDSKCNNHAGVQRVAKGAEGVRPGNQRNLVKCKCATLAQRVPGPKKHDKQKG